MTEGAQRVDAVLFDLGGVVVDIDFGRALAAWQQASRLAPPALHAAFAHDEPYRQHESGALPADAYFAHLQRTLQLDCGLQDVLEGWNAILIAPILPTVEAIDAIARHVPCYALSNTNAAHLDAMRLRFPGLLERFRTVFASHEVGHRKPDAAVFHHVLDAIGAAPRHVLFFDDLQENVAAARAVGLQAVLVRTPADVRDALAARVG